MRKRPTPILVVLHVDELKGVVYGPIRLSTAERILSKDGYKASTANPMVWTRDRDDEANSTITLIPTRGISDLMKGR